MTFENNYVDFRAAINKSLTNLEIFAYKKMFLVCTAVLKRTMGEKLVFWRRSKKTLPLFSNPNLPYKQ